LPGSGGKGGGSGNQPLQIPTITAINTIGAQMIKNFASPPSLPHMGFPSHEMDQSRQQEGDESLNEQQFLVVFHDILPPASFDSVAQ